MDTTLSEFQRNVIIGSLLGDGCLRKTIGNGNSNFIKVQKTNSKEHLEWMIDIFKYIANKKLKFKEPTEIVSEDKIIKRQGAYCFTTYCSKEFTELEKNWYLRDEKGEYVYRIKGNRKTRIKIIPKDLKLNWIIAALWHVDDGSLDKYLVTPAIVLATNCFTKEECDFLKTRLQEDLNVTGHVTKHTSGHVIKIFGDHAKNFVKGVAPYVPWKCFAYKIDISDCKEMLRNLSGVKVGCPKLTLEQVMEIRQSYPEKNQYQLAKEFNTTNSQISNILTGKCWGGKDLRENPSLSLNNTSGHNGIYYDANRNKWAAEIIINKKKYYLGRFDTKEKAAKIRQEADEARDGNVFEQFMSNINEIRNKINAV